ncbi:FkbM family methyltransferase [bacterium]|nr:MAG: FkbM family methyltransferase [bacterium]
MRPFDKISSSKMIYTLYYLLTFGNEKVLLHDNVTGVFKRTLRPWNHYKTELEGYIRHRDIKPGDYILDAGAYRGHFAIYAAIKAGPEGKVIAFEPTPWIRKLLIKNVAANSLRNVSVCGSLLWDSNSTINFCAIGSASHVSTSGNMLLPSSTIDTVLDRHRIDPQIISFVKMDIEGAEIQAIQGAQRLIEQGNAFWSVASYHIVDGEPTAGFIERYFSERGYTVKTDYPQHLTTCAYRE